MPKPLVLIESPFHHEKPYGVDLHRAYLECCLWDSIQRGECPIATHKLYTVCLDDKKQSDRTLGMEMLETLLQKTDFHAIYYDLGVSRGMLWGLSEAKKYNKKFYWRTLFGNPLPQGIAV